MSKKNNTLNDSPESTDSIINFLLRHPSFLVDHPELLSEMIVPHATGTATSLVERQVSVLREQLRQQKNQHKELIEIAKENDQLNQRIHQMSGQLLAATDLDSLIKVIKRTLLSDFSADEITLRLLIDNKSQDDRDEFIGTQWSDQSLFENILTGKKVLCGRLDTQQHQALFSDEIPEYGSSAVLPLAGYQWQGLLAIGSQNPERFNKQMGTEMLMQMADIFSLALNPYLITVVNID